MKTDLELRHNLAAKFKDQLELEPGVNADDIEISVINGIVTVKGSVPSYPDKLALLNAVKDEDGVLAWVDEIVVRIPDSHRRTDQELATTASEAIEMITTVPCSSIKVTAQDGCLILAGTVEHLYQKQAVEYAVVCLTGLVGLINLISVAASDTCVPFDDTERHIGQVQGK